MSNINEKTAYIRNVMDNSTWFELHRGQNKCLLEWVEQNSPVSDIENERLVNNAYAEQKNLTLKPQNFVKGLGTSGGFWGRSNDRDLEQGK